MRTLKFKCTGQKLSKDPSCDFTGIASGSKGYLKAYFDFDAEWLGTARVAEFYARGSGEDIYPVLIKDGFCVFPDEVTDARGICIRVVGKKGTQKIITNKVTVRQEG